MNIEMFELFTLAVCIGSLSGLVFVVYKIITEEQEKKLEESRVKIHWKDYPRKCKQTGQPRGD
jgi:hypothetical protein